MAPILAAAAVHGNGVGGFFATDDLDFLGRVIGLDATPWGWSRPLAGQWRWQVLTALFGVQAFPHLLLSWLLHLTSALLTARVVVILGQGRQQALVAAVLVAASSVAYTSTHWASGLGEVMASAFSLGALVLHFECKRRANPALGWLAGACAVGAVLAKESMVLLPVAVLLVDRCFSARGAGQGGLRPIILLGGLAGTMVVIGWWMHPNVGGEAYRLAFEPGAWFTNACTYAAWLVRLADPIRDRMALPDPALRPLGLLVISAWAVLALRERKRASRPITAGLVWFVLLLAPVIPLANHSYLYYLVAPIAGAAIACAAIIGRLMSRLAPGKLATATALLLIAYTVSEARSVRTRQTLSVADIIVDRVARDSGLLQNTLSELARLGVGSGDTVVFVNPDPQRSVDATQGVVRPDGAGFSEHSYIPLVSALRGGRALALFRPDLTVLGMSDRVPEAWERARVLRFDNQGRLYDLGRGVSALDSLAGDYFRGERWGEAREALERIIQLGGDGPEIRWQLGAARARLGDDAGGWSEAQYLLEHWPDSPRAQLLRANAARAGRSQAGAAGESGAPR